MIDYTNNFPLPELKPEGTLLQLQAYSATPSFQAVWQGEGTILDRNRIADPTAWGYNSDKREAMTREEYYSATQLMGAEAGSNIGIYGEYISSVLGKDVNKGAALRSIYFGADPLNAMPFGPSELPQTEEDMKELESTLNTLLEGEAGRQADPRNLTPNQKRIKEISDKLLYKKALETTDQNLGISFSRQILAQSEWISFATDKLGITDPSETAKIARDIDDITRIRTRVDPKFNPIEWFNTTYSDPIVQQGLLDNGITSSLIAGAPNEDEAKFRIYRSLLQGDLQKRMATYSPTWTENIRLAGASLVAGFVNSPDVVVDAGEIAGGVTLAVGGVLASPFTGGLSLGATAGGAAMAATRTTNLFLKLKTIWQANKALRGSYYAAETVLKLPMGFAPSYAKNLGLLGRTVTPTLMGFSGGALTEYARQQNEMAYAAATLYADPDAVKDYNMSEVVFAGVQGGLVGGALFGLAPNVVSSTFGATMNKLKGVNVAAPGEPVLRNTLDKRFTFKGTVIGEAVDYYGGMLKGKKTPVAIDGPLQEKLAAKAELERKNPTAQEVIKETETRVDRVETSNVETPDRAESIPDTPALKRYENESKAGYIRRVAGLKEVTNIFQLVRELSRRSPEASDNIKTATDDWDKMSPVDRIRVLTDASDHIKNLLDIESKLEGGLSPGRAKAIETLEKQRKALIKNISKSLTSDQIKALKKELKGETVLELPKALAEARNNSATTAARKAAASDLAAKLVEKAQQAAKDKEQADAIRNSIPKELLDSFDEVSTEVNLKKNVSEDTVEVIKANVAGLKPPTKTAVSKFKTAIKNALLINKIDNVRMDKIRAVISDPTKFAEIVTGNKAKAQQFYEYINKLRMGKLISREDMDLILAATVHLNFDSKAFDIQFKVEQIKNADGSFATGIVGSYETNKKTLTMNLAWKSVASVEAAQRTRAMTVLHELGHAYFQHQAKGNIYKQVLDMYVKSVGLEADILLTDKVYDLQDSLIANDFLNVYHLSNAEETFAETFSKILFTEAEFAVANLKPLQISMAQHVLNKITESVVLAANMWSSSKHYDAASKIIEDITKVDALLDDGVSVPKFVRVLATVIPSVTNRADFNRELTTRFGTSKYEVTDLEFELLDRLKNDDPALLVAFAIRKSEGRELKTQTDFNGLINTLIKYKKTQLSSLMMRTAFGIQVHTSKLIKNKTREERLAWFEDYFFNAYLKEAGEVPATKSGVSAPTYEDEYLSDIVVSTKVFPKETYASNYWLTNSNNFLSFIEEKGFDASTGYAHSGLTLSLIENLQNTFAQYDFTDMADGLVLAAHKKFVLGFNKTSLYNVVSSIKPEDIEARKTLSGWNAQWELAKQAKIDGLDLSKMTREEYVEYAIANGLAINDDQLRMATKLRTATSIKEYQSMRTNMRSKATPAQTAADLKFSTFAQQIKKDASISKTLFPEVRIRSGTANSDTWLFFKINSGANIVGDTYKAYAGFTDPYKSLTPERVNDFLQFLQKRGYNGDLKTIQDIDQGSAISDQIVMHGATEADASLALQLSREFFRDEINFLESGKDIEGSSYSQILAAKIVADIAENRKQPQQSKSQVISSIPDTIVKPLKWTTVDEAKLIIADMLESKTDLATTFAVLQSQLDPNLLKTLLDRAKSESELLTGIYNGIDKGLFSYNDKSGKWEIAKEPKKKKTPAKKKEVKAEVVKPAEPTKTPEQNEAEALADDSEVVTMENYKDLLTKFLDELTIGKFNPETKQKAIRYIGKIWQGDKVKVMAEIESGQINSYAKLKKAILQRASKAEERAEKAQFTTKLVRDPVTGIEKRIKVMIQQGETAEGATKEGVELKTAVPIGDGIVRENKEIFLDHAEAIASFVPDFLTNEEIELIGILRKTEGNNKEAGKELGVSEATISRRYNALLKKYGAFIKEAEIDAEILQSPNRLKEASEAWAKNKNAAVKEATKDAPKPKNVVKKEKNKPAKPTPNVEEAGARILETAAKAAQLANTDPPSVPVPKTTTEPTMVRVTTELTGNQPEDVVRPEVQGDALIAGTDSSVKEAVKFTPKNPLKTSFQNSTDLEANPKKKAGLLAQAARGGFDAVVFQDGSMIPINKDDVVVVGRTESTTPPGIETVVTVTKEKGVPVKRIEPKPEKPKSIGDGDPVTLTKNGQPKRKQPEQKKSDVVDETEAANIERKVNEDREALRESGLDTNSLKKFLSFYWKKMKEIDKEGGTYTTLFKTMWNKFVTINAEIYEANLKLVGEDGIKAFWKKVDELRALDKHKLATVPGHKLRTDASIFAEAGRSVNDNFIPFITPNELTIKKVGEEYVFGSSIKRVRTIVAANKTEAPVPVPPTPEKPVEGAEAKPPKEVRMPEPDEDELKDRETLIEQGWQRAEQGASTPLRLTNLIGFIFGGSNRESANWWRQTMNWMRNSSQLSSNTGRTIQSMQGKIRFIARMFDDVKAQTGHLVMAGKSAFRTAMQCASDEGRIINRISKYQMRLYRNLNNMPDQRKNLMLTVWRRLSEGADLTVADVAAAGIPASMRAEITKQANDLLMIVRQVNKTFLDLEMETGLVNTVDSMGNPVDPNKWATVQLDHEKLSRLSPSERAELINKLVAARTQRKLSSELLDINTMIVLGWLDVAPSAQHQGTALLAGDRKFRRGPAVNSFDRATLSNLDTGIVHPIGVDPKKILQDLANRGEPDRFFVLEENGTLKVYEIPRKVSQLSAPDKAKYLDAVKGNTALYTQRWRDYLQGKSLTEFEMIQTLDFKTKRGYYSDYNSKNGTNIDRPLMKTGTDETVALAVPGLVPEEVLAFKEITDVMRINLAESYFYFLKGRMFELLFQRELDRLMGTTGIKITDVLDWAYRSVEKDLQDMQKSQGWTKEQYEARVQELRIGLSRIREEYASYADTLPMLFNPEMYLSRASMAFMKMKIAVGYGLSALTETIIEYGKTNPLRIPSEIVKSLRYIMGDLRFSKSAVLEEDAGTLLFMLENFRHEHSSRFLGEVAHGAFELDNKLKTKFINSTTPINGWDKTVRAAEVGGRVAESIGSLQAMTNMVRGMGVRRWQARIWKHISKGRIQKFLAAMENPAMARLMEQLYAAAENNPIDERRLWKQFAAEARKAGFGFDYREAMLFMTYGLNSVEKIKHLEYLIRQAGGSNRGIVNIDRMADIYWNHRNNPQPGIDNKILEEVLSSYAFFLNNVIMRTTSPEPSGLGRITSLDSKTPLGRLWYALTSWIRGYQDQVILNYAYRSTLGFVAGNILLLGVVDTLIGMFREWLAGRETEDMLEEFEENPESFAIRVLRAAPIMGAANGIFEGVLSGINALSGGVWRSYNNPMSSIGINAAASSIEDIGRGVSELSGQIAGEDPIEPAKLVAAGGKIIPYNSLFNRSPIAIPARFIEDMGYLDQRGAVQQYLDLIQKEPYPYAKSKGKAGRAGTSAITTQPPPRNIAKEMAEFERLEATRPKVSQSLKDTIRTEVVNDQKGVSGRLGELLK